MRIFFRTDASTQIGTGHVMRCLTLANELREQGGAVSFICSNLPGNMITFIERKGYRVIVLAYPAIKPGKIASHYNHVKNCWKIDAQQTKKIASANRVEWLIVDHYSFDRRWEHYVAGNAKQLMVIDDLADRGHKCDILLDQNFSLDNQLHDGLLPDHCIRLFGPRYALLRPQFRESREKLRRRYGEARRILVFMGGTDSSNETAKVLEAIGSLNRPDIAVDVVLNENAPYQSDINNFCSSMPNVNFHLKVENMAKLMADADIAIGASGSATWERCCLGLPSIVIVVADNQAKIAEALHQNGIVVNLGSNRVLTAREINLALKGFIDDVAKRTDMASASRRLVDGKGVKRVARYLIQPTVDNSGHGSSGMTIRKADKNDMMDLLDWRNHPTVRKNSFSETPISLKDHTKWFNAKIDDTHTKIYIACSEKNKIGAIRFEVIKKAAKVHVMLNPDYMYKGFGPVVIRMGAKKFLRETIYIRQIIAEIKSGNLASEKAFQRAGFSPGRANYVFEVTSKFINEEI